MKKLMAILMCTMLLIATFSACKKDDNAGVADPSGDPSAQDPYTVNILFYGDADTERTNAVAAELSKLSEAKFNTTIKITRVGFGTYLQELNLMLSSGEGLDIFGNFGSLTTMVGNGQVVAMDDLLEQYGKDTKDAISPSDWSCVTVDGKIYGIPSNKDKAYGISFVMTKSIADELGIDPETIKTLDDVHAALAKAKKAHPEMYPLASYVGEMWTDYPIDPLGAAKYPIGVLLDPYGSDSLKVENYFTSDEFKELCQTMYDWNQEGLLMPDGATNTETHLSLRESGMMFANFAKTKPGFAEQEARLNGVEIYVSDLHPPISITSQVSMGWSIASTSKNPARAMQILDWLYNDFEASNISIYGVEGKDWEIKDKENGIVGNLEGVGAGSSGYPVLPWGWLNQVNSYVWENDSPDIWEQTDEFNTNAHQSPAKGFSFDSSGIINEITACQNTIDKYLKALTNGQLDPETAIPQLLKELEASGIETIIAEKQKQLDEWAAAR